jgi:subtilisin family serine protease
MRFLLSIAVIVFHFVCSSGAAQVSSNAPSANAAKPYRSDRILIQPKLGVEMATLDHFHAQHQSKLLGHFATMKHLQILEVPAGDTAESLIAKYQQSGLVEFAEPDYLIYPAAAPNDPKYLDGTEWWLNNYGQSSGTTHADISATNAWDVLNSASNIVVAVVDSGIRGTHEDLAANMWVNPNDGGYGYDAFTGTNRPTDGTGHGTMVAGILGGVGNNGKGVTGVAWRLQIMACKCLDNSGTGSDSTLIACIDYARTNGARIINASLDSSSYSSALSNAIAATRDAGIVFVASAGNGNPGRNIDTSPSYPSCYKIDNIVSVAYTTRNDTLGSLSNYGSSNVLLAAPGDQMYTTYNSSDSSYYPPFAFYNIAGTSFSAPCVAGACALLMAQYPADSYQQIMARLLASTDPLPSLAGKCRTSGRLNLQKTLRTILLSAISATNAALFQLRVSGGLNRTCAVEASTNLTGWSPVFTNSSSTNGTFDFVDYSNSPARFFRASATP